MNYTQQQLEEGTSIERANTQDSALARKIAASHLREDADYYNKLKAAGVEDECETGNIGAPLNLANDVNVGAEVVVNGGVGAEHAEKQPLSSSGLGKGGINKPLASDKLEASTKNKVGPNKVASTKTPPLGGSTIHTGQSATAVASVDPIDHFGSAIIGLSSKLNPRF